MGSSVQIKKVMNPFWKAKGNKNETFVPEKAMKRIYSEQILHKCTHKSINSKLIKIISVTFFYSKSVIFSNFEWIESSFQTKKVMNPFWESNVNKNEAFVPEK